MYSQYAIFEKQSNIYISNVAMYLVLFILVQYFFILFDNWSYWSVRTYGQWFGREASRVTHSVSRLSDWSNWYARNGLQCSEERSTRLGIAILDHFRNSGILWSKSHNPGIPGLIRGLEFQLNAGIASYEERKMEARVKLVCSSDRTWTSCTHEWQCAPLCWRSGFDHRSRQTPNSLTNWANQTDNVRSLKLISWLKYCINVPHTNFTAFQQEYMIN